MEEKSPSHARKIFAFISESKLKKHSLSCPKRKKLNENGNEKIEIEKGKLPMSLGQPTERSPWTTVEVENKNVCKIKIHREGLPETVVKPTASSLSGVDVGLEFFLTPAMPTQVTGSRGGAMARAVVKAKARAKAAVNFEPGLATAEVFEPGPPPEENLEPGINSYW